jgi:arsenate reductase
MKVLFMCTHNSCRSILSEAVFNHLAPEGMEAVSSGSFPSGRVNTRAIQTLKAAGIPTDGLSSKASDAFEGSPPDIVIFGPALKAHWGLADPSEATGSEAQIEAAFQQTLSKIQERVNAFISLPIATLSTEDLKTELARIGTL